MWLREIRNTDLAEQVGTSQQEVSRYRKGLRPNEERRKKIAKVLGVSQADLGWETESAGV
jgi:transcriptional regulator with XRE-family HTH domain